MLSFLMRTVFIFFIIYFILFLLSLLTDSKQILQSSLTHIGQALPEMQWIDIHYHLHAHVFELLCLDCQVEEKTHERCSTGRLNINTEASRKLWALQQARLVSSPGPVMNGGADPVSLTRLAA